MLQYIFMDFRYGYKHIKQNILNNEDKNYTTFLHVTAT